MINSKLNSAKLKISELRKKYSKILNSYSYEKTSTSYSSNYSNFKEREPDEITVENINEAGIAVYEQNNLIKHASSFNNKIQQLPANVSERKQSSLNTTHNRLQIQQSSNKLSPNSSISESELVTDISNELENVHFISDSSDECSVYSKPSMLSDHENSLILNSKLTPVTADINNSNSLNGKNSHESKYLIESNNQTAFSYENNTYQNEMLHAEFDSVMSSIEEVITPVKSDLEACLELKNDEHDVSHSYHLNLNKIEKEDSQFGNESLKSKSISIIQHNNSTELALIDSPLYQESSVKVTAIEHCNSENLPSKKVCSDNSNNLTDVISGCEVQVHGNGQKTIYREDFGEQIIKNKFSKVLRVGSDFKSSTLIRSSPHHSLKPALKKRPILKSCKLIRYAEANKDEFEALLKKANYVSSTLDGKQESFPYRNRTESCCDDIIKHLLRNQIQITRHFIDSHHQMYLHCCRTIKMLNNKLVCSQYGGGMGLGE